MPEAVAPAIRLRRANLGDSRRIWAWRNEPSVRAVSFNTAEIPYESHERWFASRVDDPAMHILIASIADGATTAEVGYARFDVHGHDAEISVCVDPTYRGRGIGQALIRTASAHLLRQGACERVVAQVKRDNLASVSAFEGAGFVRDTSVNDSPDQPWQLHLVAPAVLFRVDAGPGIGLGHLQRCLSLADALAESGCRIAFVVNDVSMVRDRVAAAGWDVTALDGGASWTPQDADRVVHEIGQRRSSIVIVDSDLETSDYMRRLKATGVLLCTIEDNSQDDVVADVLLNGDAHAGLQRYRAASDETEFLLGTVFTPLARDYRRGASEPARVPPLSWLVTLGGSDPQGLMPSLIDALNSVPPDVHLHVVIGPFTGNAAAVDAGLERLGDRVTVHRAPASMFALINAADLAVSAAGQTLYELAALGRPVVAIETADNQTPQLAEFVRSGAVLRAGRATDADIAARAVAMATALAGDSARVREMAEAGQIFVDGRGARRAADRILARAAHTHAFSQPVVPGLP